ncbi:DNA-directed RNA polymerase subunit alpha [bacterium]|nr:DNA-directed RNA polymerase subunit alpha [bacterium]
MLDTNLLEAVETRGPKVQKINDNRFVVEPLDRGYGVTLGNSLRRVLLSSLKGTAVTHIRIDGVAHEFSTIKGITEDTAEIILNIKKLRLRMPGECDSDNPKQLHIEARGVGVVTAADIIEDAEVEILNPELVIAHMTDEDATLILDLYVSKGYGYVSSDKQNNKGLALDVIPIDSIFSPVIRANYDVFDTRDGSRVDLDRLVLEVETDGSMKPYEAIAQAATLLQSKLQLFSNLQMSGEGGVSENVVSDANASTPIEDLDLSVRSMNCLKRGGVIHISDLINYTEDDLMKLKNFGQKSLDEINQKLAERNLSLRPSVSD